MTLSSLISRAEIARSWLHGAAFPLWLQTGLDQTHGGFHERLYPDGSPDLKPKRLRVQARQVYSCAQAGAMGWSGPWREGLESALALILDHGRRDDGFFIHQFDAQNRPLDLRADLYDQAFVLFALAHASQALERPDLMQTANALWTLIESQWAHPSGGFLEGEVEPAGRRRQNPHMHLFEAALACIDSSQNDEMANRMLARASRLHELFMQHFYASTGATNERVVREFFTGDWAPAPGDDGDVWEPGHSFEWIWLCKAWDKYGWPGAHEVLEALGAAAEKYGVDSKRNVAIDELWIGGAVKSAGARLWPQTERLKAAIAGIELYGADPYVAKAAAAFDGLWLYVQPNGFWADRMDSDGSLIQESAPASSFYHILVALSELFRIASR